MTRQKLNRAYFRKKGIDKFGRKRYVLEKEICGRVRSVSLDPEKLWKFFVSLRDGEKPSEQPFEEMDGLSVHNLNNK